MFKVVCIIEQALDQFGIRQPHPKINEECYVLGVEQGLGREFYRLEGYPFHVYYEKTSFRIVDDNFAESIIKKLEDEFNAVPEEELVSVTI